MGHCPTDAPSAKNKSFVFPKKNHTKKRRNIAKKLKNKFINEKEGSNGEKTQKKQGKGGHKKSLMETNVFGDTKSVLTSRKDVVTPK